MRSKLRLAVFTFQAGYLAAAMLWMMPKLLGASPTEQERDFVEAATAGLIRKDFTGFVGFTFTVGSEPIRVTALGRWCLAGNSNAHQLRLVHATTYSNVVGGTVMVSMAGAAAGSFIYGQPAAPIFLAAGESYLLQSEETSGRDEWYDFDVKVTSRPIARVDGPVYNNVAISAALTNYSYGPLNFKYLTEPVLEIVQPPEGGSVVGNSVVIAAAGPINLQQLNFYDSTNYLGTVQAPLFQFAWTNVTPGSHQLWVEGIGEGGIRTTSAFVRIESARNIPAQIPRVFLQPSFYESSYVWDHGFTGMKIRIGSRPLVVTQLGRLIGVTTAPSSIIKLVQASDGSDLDGALVTVSSAGAPIGEFAYAPLPHPVVLAGGTSYYLVTQKATNRNSWTEPRMTVMSSEGAAVEGGVSFDNDSPWLVYPVTNFSFAPLNFQYLADEIRITAPLDGSGLVLPPEIRIETTPNIGLENVEFLANDQRIGGSDQEPFSFSWQNPPAGSYRLQAIATSLEGLVLTSKVVTVTVAATNLSGAEQPFTRAIAIANVSQVGFNNSGSSGMRFRVGPRPLIVTQLGRWVVSGDTQTLTLKIVRAMDSVEIPGAAATVVVNPAMPGMFQYQSLASPVVLAPFTEHDLLTDERWNRNHYILTSGPGQYEDEADWIDSVSLSSAGLVRINPDGLTPSSYVPVDFKFRELPLTPRVTILSPQSWSPVNEATLITTETTGQVVSAQLLVNGQSVAEDHDLPYSFVLGNLVPGFHDLRVKVTDIFASVTTSQVVRVWSDQAFAPQPFVAAVTPGTLRNDFSGQVGMSFSVGPRPITLTALGRWNNPGDIARHPISLYRADHFVDSPGIGTVNLGIDQFELLASVAVYASAGTPGAFQYQYLPAPLVLPPNSTYFLVSREFQTPSIHDHWYDLDTTAVPVNGAIVHGPVYSKDGSPPWVMALGRTNHAYGPVNFLFVPEEARPQPRLQIFRDHNLLRLSVTGPAGELCHIEVTQDFQTWLPVTELILSGQPIEFAEQQPGIGAPRFYRARIPRQ